MLSKKKMKQAVKNHVAKKEQIAAAPKLLAQALATIKQLQDKEKTVRCQNHKCQHNSKFGVPDNTGTCGCGNLVLEKTWTGSEMLYALKCISASDYRPVVKRLGHGMLSETPQHKDLALQSAHIRPAVR